MELMTPVPDILVVLPGDMLQKWNSGAVQVAKYRVVPPTEGSHRNMPRQSIVFVVIPDRDFEKKPLGYSSKYGPIICMDFILVTVLHFI